MRMGCAILLLLAAESGWAASFNSASRGTTSAGFLKIPVGARAIALGEAYSAVVDDASAMYWNPAALTRIQQRSATFMHAAYIDSGFLDFTAYGQRLGKTVVMGLGVQYFSAGQITETDETGTEVGAFAPNDVAVSVGFASELGDEVPAVLGDCSVGMNVKHIRSKIINSAQTGAFDVGLLSSAYFNGRLRTAFTVTNLGGHLKFDQKSEEIPVSLRLGSAYEINDHWLSALDVGLPRDNDPFVAVGTEYVKLAAEGLNFAGRIGFNSRTIGDIDGVTGISLGMGMAVHRLALDYGFLPFGSIGLTHRLSLSYRW